MSLLVRRTTQTCTCAHEGVLTALFHSSPKNQWKKNRTTALPEVEDRNPPKRVDDAAPRKSTSKALTRRGKPKPEREQVPAFVRDTVPHTEAERAEGDSPVGRNPSFRRRTQDWTDRTGKWSASRFGGGDHRGSQMGLREDRPQSYGLGHGHGEPSTQTRREGLYARPEGPPPDYADGVSGRAYGRQRFPSLQRFHPDNASRDDRGDRSLNGTAAFPQRTPFGKRQEDRDSPPLPRPRVSSQKTPFGLRDPEDDGHGSATNVRATDDRPSSRASSSKIPFGSQSPRKTASVDANKARISEYDEFRPARAESREKPAWRSQDSPRKRLESPDPHQPYQRAMDLRIIDDQIDELLPSSTLKNRKAAPTPFVPKSPPKPPPPPPKPKLPRKAPAEHEKSLFSNDAVILGRNNVPIVTKADPATASTTSAYSPRMDLGNDLPTKFTSPPLLPGLVNCVLNSLDKFATPTKIQALSLKYLVDPWTAGQENTPGEDSTAVSTVAEPQPYKEYLLASETGSGKSIAYLLPMLQALKVSEVRRLAENAATPIASKRGLNPRALVLAPTHELARQLSATAKALVHEVKLRVLCASRRNLPTRPAAEERAAAGKSGRRGSSAGRMKALMSFADDGAMGEFEVKETGPGTSAFPVDVVVGTPMKLMEMVRGRGWDRDVEFAGGPAAIYEMEKREQAKGDLAQDADSKDKGPKRRRGRDSVPGVGEWRSSPEMGLSEVEWVIVDEADVLFDSDFQETTRMLLADIAKARGHEVPFITLPIGLLAPMPPKAEPVPLSSRGKEKAKTAEEKETENEKAPGKIVVKRGPSYLNAYHPSLLRLVSPNLHHLPKSLKTEWVNWSGGNKSADIERRLRKVWAADAADGLGPGPESLGDMSKVLIFCNKNSHVEDLGTFLEEKGIKNIPLSAKSDNRKRGNNKHLEGFIRLPGRQATEQPLDDWSSSWVADKDAEEEEEEKMPVKAKVKAAPRALVPIMKQGNEPPAVKNDPMNVPHVMITTSFLSRGLDFSPDVKHVFIVDDPRSMVDFLHRAGRTGRAGENGKVVIFGKMAGRGSLQSQRIKKQVKALVA
ncbi:hypothetical protein C8F04DRAFT_1126349 [Mycena alexandri]|uniref:RNA helicase n=1 Tax=Mycena alexandri TaxID=1745969 RepID=A0AAD6SHD0_9AGAR|nr:hypothetical protein C8F04DRAFT_1126349 [Mycena alexandri]